MSGDKSVIFSAVWCRLLIFVLFTVITLKYYQGIGDALWLMLKSVSFHLLSHFRKISFAENQDTPPLAWKTIFFSFKYLKNVPVFAEQIMLKKKVEN